VTDLERHHRRLLALYPRDHRERHGEEMLDVLISRGRADRLDTVDLLWNAFRLHLRRMVAADGGIDPMDVLSTVARLGPICVPLVVLLAFGSLPRRIPQVPGEAT
jgi:hypothetical protein